MDQDIKKYLKIVEGIDSTPITTPALAKALRSDEDYNNGEVHQALLNIGYDFWQNEQNKHWGYEDMVHNARQVFGKLTAFAILSGKANQQITNGGIMQYIDNGYAGNYNYRRAILDWDLHMEMIELMEDLRVDSLTENTATAHKFYLDLPHQVSLDEEYETEETCEDCGGSGEVDMGWNDEEEEEEIEQCSTCDGSGSEIVSNDDYGTIYVPDRLDSYYYSFNEEYMNDLNNYFRSQVKIRHWKKIQK